MRDLATARIGARCPHPRVTVVKAVLMIISIAKRCLIGKCGRILIRKVKMVSVLWRTLKRIMKGGRSQLCRW